MKRARPGRGTAAAAALGCVLLAVLATGERRAWSADDDAQATKAAAPARPRLALSATLDPQARRVTGTATWSLVNASDRPLAELLFWLYPNRYRERPPSLGDVGFDWFYPNGFSPGSMTIRAVRVLASGKVASAAQAAFVSAGSPAGGETLLRVTLPAALAPGDRVDVALDFTTRVPERLGAFGCVKAGCTLLAGFYPFPLALGPGGFARDAPPDRFDFQARVMVPAGSTAVLSGARADLQPAPMPGAAGFVTVEGADRNAIAVTLVVAPALHADGLQAGGRSAVYFHRDVRPPSSADEVLPYVREDRPGLVLETARDALDLLADRGLAGPPAPSPPLILVEAPLRHALAVACGRVVLVSDRLFEIFPLARVRRYHRRELARAVFAAALDARARAVEPDPDVELSAEVIATHAADALDVERFRHLEFARELLRPLAFLPAVDQLIYAPLVAASSSYFGDVEPRAIERDIERDDVRRFSHGRPDGRFIEAKLVDLMGSERVTRLARMVVEDGVPLRQATARVFGAPVDWFWTQWLAPVPARVNYRLAAIRTTPLPPRGVHVVVDVERQNADLLEPVTLRLVDRDDKPHELVWNARGAAHRFEADLPAGLASVQLDPRHRLAESAVGSLPAEEDPLSDNERPRPLRFIYSGFGALLDVTSLDAQAAAALTLKPRHDLHNAVLLLASHTPAVLAGLSATYERRFGRQADANRLTSSAGFGLSLERLDPNYAVAAGQPSQPGWRYGAALGFLHDDRDFFIDPWRAVGVQLDLGGTLTALENGDRLLQLTAAAELVRLVELRPGHVLALDVQASATGGDIQHRSQLLRLGGPTGLRAYALDELLGRARAVARVELRDRYVSNLDWNLGHFTAVRGFGGNLFAEAGLISSCDDWSVGKGDVFTDVGYTFRVLHDAFGVYQQLLAVDVAVPLNRHDRTCFGQHSLGAPAEGQPTLHRPPFTVLISFLPAF
ncbi:MAG TPA: hypothetical protein VIU64_09625 [Polyangia bacterium]